MTSPGDDEHDREPVGRSVGERLIHLAFGLLLLMILHFSLSDVVVNLFTSAHKARVDNDFKTLADALVRHQITTGRKFCDPDLDKLCGTTLQNPPRDPEGHAYLYDWFFERLVYLGPDGVLQTYIPGTTRSTDGESDDKVYPLRPLDRLVFASVDGGESRVQVARLDGSDVRTLFEVKTGVVGVSAVPAKGQNQVALAVRTASGSRLAMVDVTGERPEPVDLTPGTAHDVWPAFGLDRSPWVYYQTDGVAGRHAIRGVNVRDRSTCAITPPEQDALAPAIDASGTVLWYAVRTGARSALYRLPLARPSDVRLARASATESFTAPAPSPSGDQVACIVTGGKRSRLEIFDLPDARVRFSRDDVLPESVVVWSPDGEKVAYLAQEGGTTRIFVTDIQSRVTAPLPLAVTRVPFAWLQN